MMLPTLVVARKPLPVMFYVRPVRAFEANPVT